MRSGLALHSRGILPGSKYPFLVNLLSCLFALLAGCFFLVMTTCLFSLGMLLAVVSHHVGQQSSSLSRC
jgi:hypothetical protein